MGTKQFDNYADLITFTRASGGTALRPISYGSELVTNGGFDADSDWTKGTGWTISGGQLSHASGSATLAYQTITLTAGKTYRATVDVVSISVGTGSIQFRNGGTTTSTLINSTGTFEVFYTAEGNNQVAIFAGAATVITVDNISVKEVLFDQPNAPLTLFNHPTNIPRIEYDADGNRLGLLVEEQRKNLLERSEDFSNAAWTKGGASIDTNVVIAPDGTLTGDKIVEDATSGSHQVIQGGASTSGVTYTASYYVKAAGRTSCRISFQNEGSATFNLTTESVITNLFVSASITAVGNGWYRCVATETKTNSLGNVYFGPCLDDGTIPYTGDGTSGIYIWGAQLEAGSFPTSYIPTSGSTATRAADVASIPTSAFGYNASEGTVVVEAEMTNSVTSGQRYVIGSNSINSRWVYKNDTKDTLTSYDGDSVLENTLSNLSDGVFFKAASSTDQSERALAVDGSIATKSTTGGIASLTASIRIGCANTNDKQLNGHIKSIKYYPRRLSNAQLVELTQ